MSKEYTNPRAPASFTGIGKFRENHKNIKAKDITTMDTYIYNKAVGSQRRRRAIIVGGNDSQWQADLLDIKNWGHESYILTVIDVFSRYAFAEFLSRKTAAATYDAFERIIKRNNGRVPETLYTDRGLEFSMTGLEQKGKKRVKVREDFYDKWNVKRLETKSDLKAALVERFNRTLRLKIQRYLSWRNTGHRITALHQLVDSYNDTIHPIHGKTPREVYEMNEKQQEKLYEIPFEDLTRDEFNKQVIRFDFKVGDHVRLLNSRGMFEKSSNFRRWSDKVYRVTEVWATNPPTYTVKNIKTNTEKYRRQYKWEMQRITYQHNENQNEEEVDDDDDDAPSEKEDEEEEKPPTSVQVPPVRQQRQKGQAPSRWSARLTK
jgi:transposase InsO family protein